MQQQKLPKGLPKRARNDKAKTRRARSWERGQRRKAERRQLQKARKNSNDMLRQAGRPTPWQRAKAARRARRAANT